MPRRKNTIHRINEELMILCAVLYYEDHLDQQSVAKKLGISQSQISHLLREARERGVVEIQIHVGRETNLTKVQKVKGLYSLDELLIVPSVPVPMEDGMGEGLVMRLGVETARWLESYVRKETRLGIAWGRELFECARALTLPRYPLHLYPLVVHGVPSAMEVQDHHGLSIMAALMSKSAYSVFGYSFLCTVNTRHEDAMLRLYRYSEMLADLDVVLATAHHLGPRSLFTDILNEMQVTAGAIVRSRVVGEFAGYPLTARGQPASRAAFRKFYGRTALPLAFSDLARFAGNPAKRVVLVAGGRRNIEVIRAVLTARLCNVLITDSENVMELADSLSVSV